MRQGYAVYVFYRSLIHQDTAGVGAKDTLVSAIHARTHTYTHAHTHARTQTHANTHKPQNHLYNNKIPISFSALLTPCWGEGLEGGPFKPNYPYHGPSEVINPMEEYSYEFMDNFFQEIAEDFPDGYIHLGLDEVNHNCW